MANKQESIFEEMHILNYDNFEEMHILNYKNLEEMHILNYKNLEEMHIFGKEGNIKYMPIYLTSFLCK